MPCLVNAVFPEATFGNEGFKMADFALAEKPFPGGQRHEAKGPFDGCHFGIGMISKAGKVLAKQWMHAAKYGLRTLQRFAAANSFGR